MKRQLSKITLVLALLSSSALFSQQKGNFTCNTDAVIERYFATHPQERENFEKSQNELNVQRLANEANNRTQAKPSAFVYTVPVVFHVLHQGGSENIPESTCIAALNQVNKDFSRNSQDTNTIFGPFKNLFIDSEIKFMLARKDPQGNCTSGIVKHIDSKGSNWNQTLGNDPSYFTYTWDPTRYLNVYVVTLITDNGVPTPGTFIGGYTNYPGVYPTGSPKDVIVYIHSELDANYPNPGARSLSHEIGHWLNLRHTWGNTNNPGVACGDDNISDTPITKGTMSSCPAVTSNTNFTCNSPNPGNAADYFHNVQNIMDYASCKRNFTAGQTTAMRTALASAVANRQNLWQNSNLAFTDVNSVIPCAPKAEFMSTSGSYTVCAGGNLTMKDLSFNGTVSSYLWAADNLALITSPNGSQTSINFPIAGTTQVSLTVSNNQGSDMQVHTVYVLDGTAAIMGPHFESFENEGLPPDWSITDGEGDTYTWEQTGQVAYDQNSCYFINGAAIIGGSSEILQMPIMDVKNNAGSVFEFAYAYRQQSASHDDKLRIQGSKDCGGTWQEIQTLSATQMALNSGGVGTGQFFPNPWEWKIYTISSHPNWNNYTNSSSVWIRFNFVEGANGFGNNIFIDAASFYNLLGVNELSKSVSFSMYPNPTTSGANVHFNLNDAAFVKISVMDVLGKEVLRVTDQRFEAGEQTITFNEDNTLQKGIYFVNLSVNGATMSGKLIVK